MTVRRELTNQRFGRLVALRPTTGRSKKVYWVCRCDCGKEKNILSASLTGGTTQSCGCLHIEKHKRHGLSTHPLADTWYKMMDRCYNPEHMHYRSYGGRGIDVCERWHDIAIFIADNEGKKLPGLSIDRRDNDLGYFPENCIWSDRKQQGRNRRTNVSIDFRGKTQCMQDWSDELGIPKGVIWKRLKLGQTMDEVVASQAARGPRRKRAA